MINTFLLRSLLSSSFFPMQEKARARGARGKRRKDRGMNILPHSLQFQGLGEPGQDPDAVPGQGLEQDPDQGLGPGQDRGQVQVQGQGLVPALQGKDPFPPPSRHRWKLKKRSPGEYHLKEEFLAGTVLPGSLRLLLSLCSRHLPTSRRGRVSPSDPLF